jgi:hypothetical protein
MVEGAAVRWEERLLAELDDLEQQAEGLYLAERDATVAELRVSTYAEVELSARLHASIGSPVHLSLVGGASAEGVVARAGRDWLLLGQGVGEAVVRLGAVLRVRGASERAVTEQARPVVARLGLASVLRQLTADGEALALTLTDGGVVRGRLRRVGADFVELVTEGGRQPELVPIGCLVVVRRLL